MSLKQAVERDLPLERIHLPRVGVQQDCAAVRAADAGRHPRAAAPPELCISPHRLGLGLRPTGAGAGRPPGSLARPPRSPPRRRRSAIRASRPRGRRRRGRAGSARPSGRAARLIRALRRSISARRRALSSRRSLTCARPARRRPRWPARRRLSSGEARLPGGAAAGAGRVAWPRSRRRQPPAGPPRPARSRTGRGRCAAVAASPEGYHRPAGAAIPGRQARRAARHVPPGRGKIREWPSRLLPSISSTRPSASGSHPRSASRPPPSRSGGRRSPGESPR